MSVLSFKFYLLKIRRTAKTSIRRNHFHICVNEKCRPREVQYLILCRFHFDFCLRHAEGPFQSDALLVPEGCLFDHIHNASRCWPFVRWNQTGAAACQDRGMQMRSFAMLLPCGISLFSGVEFVCCPKHFKGKRSGFSPFFLSKPVSPFNHPDC